MKKNIFFIFTFDILGKLWYNIKDRLWQITQFIV